MAGPTVEEQVVLDADGRALFAAMAAVEQRIKQIKTDVNLINDAAAKGAKTFDATLAQTTKNLQRALGSLRTLATGNNTASGRIQDLNANRALARQTIDATKYARELNVARNSVEALEARIAKLNRTAASQGTITTKQRDQLSNYEKTLGVLKQLDKQYDQLLAKSRRVSGVDMSAEINAVIAARTRLQNASLSGRRVNFGTELNGVTDAQAALAERIAAARRTETQAIGNSLRARKELAVADVNGMRSVAELERARVANNQRLTTLRAELRTAGSAEQRTLLETLEIEKARGRQIQTNLRAAERQVTVEQRGLAQQQRNTLSARAGRAAGNTALYGGVAMVGYAAFNGVADVARTALEFEDGLAKLQAIAGATDGQMQKLKASILEVGTSSKFTLTELTNISQQLAQAGVSASDMTAVLKSVTTLATASGSTPAEAVNLVTSALGGFQLQASESARVSDLMTTALNRTKLTVAQVGQAIQYVGATAYEENISLEQLLATVGAVAQAGVKSGSTIGTGFRQFLVDLQTPTAKLTEQLEKLGLSQKDVDVSTRGLSAVLETLSKAGFGSAQAYEGLETRAAAFYLTAKNNVDVMDDLQIAFANQGAAALANERAMNSLSAQWQRFQNIVASGFIKDTESLFDDLKTGIKDVSDFLEKTRADNEAQAERIRTGNLQTVGDYITKYGGEYGTRKALNFLSGSLVGGEGKVGDIVTGYDAVADAQKRAAQTSEALEEKLADTSDTISKQGGVIGELEKEYIRLQTQKDSLINNDKRSAAEMTTLTSRFQGLAGHLTNTKNLYENLTGAVQGFIAANQKALAGSLAVQRSNLAQQNAGLRTERGSLLARIKNSPEYKNLSAADKAAIDALGNNVPGSDAYTTNIPRVANIGTRLAGTSLGGLANQLATNTQTAVSNVAQANAYGAQQTSAQAASTSWGSEITRRLADIEGMISSGKLNDAEKQIAQARAYMKTFRVNSAGQPFIDDASSQLTTQSARIKAERTPSKAETRAAAREEREADAQAKKVTQSEVEAILKTFGLAFGSGVRTKAQQDRLHEEGKTPATGATSAHSNGGIARDLSVRGLTDDEARRTAAAIKQRLKDAGITARVEFETGKGKNQGTGRHIHVGVQKGATRAVGNGNSAFDTQAALDASQLQLNQRSFNTSLRNLKGVSSQELFDATVENAQTALARLSEAMREDAKNDLAKISVLAGNPRYEERMGQVEDAISQNVEQLQQAIADGLIAGVNKQFKAIGLAAELAMKPFDDRLAAAQGAVSGLGLYSNRFAPDYTTQLAQTRVSQAQEAQLRARQSSLPYEINAKQGQLDGLISRSSGLSGNALETTKQQIETLTKSIADLRTEKAGLDAQFSAGSLIPDTFRSGLEQAAQAYSEVNGLSRTFQDEVIGNLGDAITQTNGEFTTFFSSILSGQRSVLGAMGNFVRSMISYLDQLAAQFLAKQAINALFSLLGVAAGPTIGGLSGSSFASGLGAETAGWAASTNVTLGSFNGGPAMPEGLLGGGRVTNGSDAHDSVTKRLAKGEWVVNKRAVDSVGNDFMAQLNNHGAKALDTMQAIPVVQPQPAQEMSVYVVQPDQKPTLSKNDVLVTFQQDVLSGGETKKLIKHVANGG